MCDNTYSDICMIIHGRSCFNLVKSVNQYRLHRTVRHPTRAYNRTIVTKGLFIMFPSVNKITIKDKLILQVNPNTIKSYKILQKLSPKHAAHGVAQSTYPNYRHGKACLSKQPPWHAAGDPRLARGRSRVLAPGPAGALRAFFLHPPFLPPSGDSFFHTFPTNPAKVLGLMTQAFIFGYDRQQNLYSQ